MAKGRQASGNPPTPRAPDKSGQSDCPTIEEKTGITSPINRQNRNSTAGNSKSYARHRLHPH